MSKGVRELRLAVTVDDWEAAVAFYRDVLGMPQLADFSSDEGRVVLLSAGRATLELIDPRQADFIDRVEVGQRVAGPIRVALEVEDSAATAQALVEGGARLVKEPTETPWRSLNARLEAPGDLQLTLFQELDPA